MRSFWPLVHRFSQSVSRPPFLAGVNPGNYGGDYDKRVVITVAPNGGTYGVGGNPSVLAGTIAGGGALAQTTGSNAQAIVEGATTASSTAGVSYVGEYKQAGFIQGTGRGNLDMHLHVAGADSVHELAAAEINVKAFASALATSGHTRVSAYAHVQTGVSQFGSPLGPNSLVTAAITNDGAINVNATANAFGRSGARGSATATAAIGRGIFQSGDGVNNVLSLTNNGSIKIQAQARAVASHAFSSEAFVNAGVSGNAAVYQSAGATASAHVAQGIFQNANGHLSPSASLTNTGTINIYATATATAGHASAYNHANAHNSATATDFVGAGAHASIGNGIDQAAAGTTQGALSITLGNTHNINVDAKARAVATGAYAGANAGGQDNSSTVHPNNAYGTAIADAEAFAHIGSGIDQHGFNAPGMVGLTNTGSIGIHASASAFMNTSSGFAHSHSYANGRQNVVSQSYAGARVQGTVGVGIDQSIIFGPTSTSVAQTDYSYRVAPVTISLTNGSTESGGTISIGARGYAQSYNARADAFASADGTGNAHARANGTADAYASATIGTGINQRAQGGAPSVALTNYGTIRIKALATATGSTNYAVVTAYSNGYAQAQAVAGDVAYAAVQNGIHQAASGHYVQITEAESVVINAPTAKATLTNNSSIFIDATANAHDGSSATAYARATGIHNVSATASAGGFATAYVAHGISQTAMGPKAQVDLYNSGYIQIDATAKATASSGLADAGAFANSLHSGSKVSASAAAVASANAVIGTGIYQAASLLASKQLGHVNFSNSESGLVEVIAQAQATATNLRAHAHATASGGNTASAYAIAGGVAHATVVSGVKQEADYASLTLTNSGTLSIKALATASGSGDRAYASAYNAFGIHATANAGGLADALLITGVSQHSRYNAPTVTLTNNGTINIGAGAFAHSYGDHATAFASSAFDAHAYANAGAFAQAIVGRGISQYAQSSTAVARLTNYGTINIGARAFSTSYNARANAHAVGATQSAYASAVAGAVAGARIGDGIYQYSDGSGPSVALDNESTGKIHIEAQATANAHTPRANSYTGSSFNQSSNARAGAQATAYVGYATSSSYGPHAGIYQSAYNGDATVGLTNAGKIEIYALAKANTYGSAVASEHYGVGGSSSGYAGAFAHASVVNGIYQAATHGTETGYASVTLTNKAAGSIKIGATATAVGDPRASARARVGNGIEQIASSYGENDAGASLTNSGAILIGAYAMASGNVANGNAFVGRGIYQGASAYSHGTQAAAHMTNYHFLTVQAVATGLGTEYGYATAGVGAAINQNADNAFFATAQLTNYSGAIHVSATALAKATHHHGGGYANASAYVNSESGGGIVQHVNGFTSTASLTNSATIDIGAKATANAPGGTANANAHVNHGVGQYAVASETGSVSFANTHSFKVHATANASHASNADANARATGLYQSVYENYHQQEVRDSFRNSVDGTFQVNAKAVAVGTNTSFASALAYGVTVKGDPINLDVSNSGKFNVTAQADAYNARAGAVGFEALATNSAQHPSGSPQVTIWDALDTVRGTFTNTGTMTVIAVANNPVPVTGPQPLQSYGADATGIDLTGSIITATLNNNGGRIEVVAETSGTTAKATGIVLNNYTGSLVATNPVVPNTAQDFFMLNNNGGTIIARQSVDGGLTWKHGTAIDLSNAPNASNIMLTGTVPGDPNVTKTGYIYGDIILQTAYDTADTITVARGETKFDGKINPNSVSMMGSGLLQINSTGTLYMVNQRYALDSYSAAVTPHTNDWYDGAAAANVYHFGVDDGGTLALELPVDLAGSAFGYPQITANSVTLSEGAKLQIRPSSWNGLYSNGYVFTNVIKSATTIDGSFVTTTDPSTGLQTVSTDTTTPLLVFTPVYYAAAGGAAAHMDLNMTRVGFGDVAGLTWNQSSVGSGLEGGYIPGQVEPAGPVMPTL